MKAEQRSSEMVQQMLVLLKDPLFCSLRRMVDDHPLPWTEFCKLQMPLRMTCEQAWDLLNALRRQTAIELPFHDGDGRRGWYSPTRPSLADLDSIDRRCHENSWLDLVIQSRNTTYFLIEAHVDDAITAVREDGVRIGYEKAREVLLNERDPEGSEEILLLNGHQAIWDLDHYAKTPCTPELILDIYKRVAQGTGEQTTPSSRQRSNLWKGKRLDSETALELVADLINKNGLERAEHPLLLAIAIRHLFMTTFPLPAWNGVVSSLVMKLLFKKSLLPVLAFVPIIKTCQEWESGGLSSLAVMASVKDSEVLVDNEVDYTIYVSVLTRLVRQKLDEVECELNRVIKRDEAFSQALREDLNINYRQRMLLQTALSNPEAVFRVEAHRKMYQIAYATARADLLKLVDLGFLGCIRKRRAFDFLVAPGLRQLLAEHTQKDAVDHVLGISATDEQGLEGYRQENELRRHDLRADQVCEN